MLLVFDGHILGLALASGDRFVVGRWPRSPFGGIADVMWSQPSGRHVLLASHEPAARFISRHYRFERGESVPVAVDLVGGRTIEVRAGPVSMSLTLGPRGVPSRLLRLRPPWLRTNRAWIALEDLALRPLVRPLFGAQGVRTRGVTAADAREWYAIHDFRPLVQARASVDGVDLGAAVRARAAGFGFSEFPAVPALVRVTSMIEEG